MAAVLSPSPRASTGPRLPQLPTQPNATTGRQGRVAAGKSTFGHTASARQRSEGELIAPANTEAKPRSILLALFISACALFLLAPAPAAHAAKRIVGTIGNPSGGLLGGQFSLDVGAIAVNQSGAGGVAPGTVYVLDGSNVRVQQFTPAGAFIRAWGVGVLTDGGTEFEICNSASECLNGRGNPSHPGSLGSGGGGAKPQGIAVDQASGHVYVATGHQRIAVFSATGEPEGAFGWGVLDGSSELQFCTVASGCQEGFNPVGAPGGELSIPIREDGLEVAPAGEVYYGPGNNRIDVFQPTLSGATVTDVTFARAFGRDVVRTGPGDSAVDEQQRLTVRATGGTYVLRLTSPPFQEITDPIGFDAPAATLESELNAVLAPVGASVTVSGGPGDATGSSPYLITFGGSFAGDDVFPLEAFDGNLTGSPSEAIPETLQEGGAFETCVAADGDVCKAGSGSTPPEFDGGAGDLAFDPAGNLYTLQPGASTNEAQLVTVDATAGAYALSFEGQTTDPIPYDADKTVVRDELQALSTIGPGNVLVSNRSGGGIRRRVDFVGALAATDVSELVCDGSALAGDDPAEPGAGPSCTVQTEEQASVDRLPRVQEFDPDANPLADDFGVAALLAGLGPNANASRLAVDPDTGHLLVAANGVDSAGQMRVLELDSAGDAFDLHGPDLTVQSTLGIANAPDAAGGNLYLLTNSPPTLEGAYVLAEAKPVIDPLASCATTTNLSGSVFSDGEVVSYHFEYSIDGEQWTKVPATDVNVGPAPAEIAVAQQASGLSGSQPYRFRLLATRGGLTRTSDEVSCTTDPAPPAVSAAGVVVDQTAAIIKARVNPQNEPTTYRFEYTTEEDFAANGWVNAIRVPDPDASAGSGNAPTLVAQQIAGLAPATAYRARLLAGNATGATTDAEQSFTTLPPYQDPNTGPCPNEAFRTGPSAQLPDCRAYELVSPPGAANLKRFGGYVAPDGSRLGFYANAAFAGAEQNTIGHYLSARTSTGWTTEPVDPPFTAPFTESLFNFSSDFAGFSEDFTRVFILTQTDVDPADTDQSYDTYLREPDADFRWVSMPPAGGDFAGNSADASHAVLQLAGNVWEWVEGAVRQVNLRPDGSVCPDARVGNWDGSSNSDSALAAVSADGRRVFFACEGGLFVRENGALTREIAAPGLYAGASRDGSAVFFTTTASFVPADTNGAVDLYRYDLDAGTYTRLSTGGDPAPGVPLGKGVVPSADGSRVYFRAQGVLATEPNANGQSAGAGIDNLYLYDQGQVRFVASPQTGGTGAGHALHVVAPSGSVFSSPAPAEWDLSPDGAHLAFATSDPLLPADGDSAADVYLYDLATESLALATTGPRSGDGDFAATLGDGYSVRGVAYRPRLLSADGRFLFFQTAERLVTGDVNDKVDVYERDLHTGRTWLISSGASALSAGLIGVSEDGASVAFLDPRPLAPQDTDAERSAYVARIGGGFPADVYPSCQGEVCKPPPSAPPAESPPPSSLVGPGNPSVTYPRHCSAARRRVRRAKRRLRRAHTARQRRNARTKLRRAKRRLRRCRTAIR